MKGAIVAVSPEGVIGVGGTIPWRYPGDLRRFKRVTLGATVVMGRATWESIGERALPGRRNVVVTSRAPGGAGTAGAAPEIGGVAFARDVDAALDAIARVDPHGDVWFIGGARIYEEALRQCDVLDVTYVPDHVDATGAVRFPAIDPRDWVAGEIVPHEDEPALTRRVYTRRTA